MRQEMVGELQRRLRELPAPEAPSHLLANIMTSRSAGARVELPRLRRTPAPWLIGALAAAAALALLMNTRRHERPATRNESDYRDIANALSIWPPEALAQEAGPHRTPSYAIVRDLRDAGINRGRWTYRICGADDDAVITVKTQCYQRLTVLLTRAEWGGRPAWRMSREVSWRRDTTDQWGSADKRPLDTTYADTGTLRPVYHAVVGDRIRVIHRFTWDTVYEAVDIGGPHPRSWRAHAVIPGAVDAPLVLRWRWLDLDLLVQALPLSRDWRGSVYSVGLVSRDSAKAAIEPLDLRVAGSERIGVPAGTFECWKIVGRDHRDVTLTWWVSKHGGWLVKSLERGPDWLTERSLVRTSRPEP